VSREAPRIGLGVIQVFVGLSAVAGGLGLTLDPSGSNVGIPLEYLADSPFEDYLIPGMVLLVVNGLGSLVGAAATFTRRRFAGEAGLALGAFLVLWILAQLFWVAWFHWLHALYLCLGGLELGLAWVVRKRLIGAQRSAS
jgi:hypothetical protein